ncbi:TetR/AcrR family transcriptional regulator [Nocardia sp. NPDC057668]|uniref:TetR/AcrR family transcriptional regulator n=1 Tax=Nocardia sp. NPDC057668 TaxID=3346202 RepID=UPI003670D9DB
MPASARPPQQPSLLERRKTRAMLEIQEIALGLFESDGYRKASVEQVAAAAGISASTIYRYFGTKEQLVVWDHVDAQALTLLTADTRVLTPAELLAEVAALAPAVIAALVDPGEEQRIVRRVRLMTSEPEVRTGELLQIHALERHVRALLAHRLGRDDNDLAIRYAAAQAAWGYLAAVDHWAATDFTEPLGAVLGRATGLMIEAVAAVLNAAE